MDSMVSFLVVTTEWVLPPQAGQSMAIRAVEIENQSQEALETPSRRSGHRVPGGERWSEHLPDSGETLLASIGRPGGLGS
jgi:hypothetical protein